MVRKANLLSMDTITAILITVHIIISIALIALVLLNSGKGGGLSDMLGGPGSSGNIGQTSVSYTHLTLPTTPYV